MDKYLFITVANNSGSKLILQLVAECKNAIARPRQIHHGVAAHPREGERYTKMTPCNNRIWTQKNSARFTDETNYDFDQIKADWHKVWAQDKHFKTANPKVFLEKTPSNVLKAQMYEKHFPNAYFMIMVRNPYAFIEGILRRNNRLVEAGTKHWIATAKKQIENMGH
jgi:hypothetical protein